MAGEPILIVDDNPTNLKLLTFLLNSKGYETRTAIDAETALVILETYRPRALMLDLQLPGLDGLSPHPATPREARDTRSRDHRSHGARDAR